MKKILVTGGGGFIGMQLVKAYLQQGNQVVVIDNLSSFGSQAFSAPNLKFYKVDLLDQEKVFSIIAEEKPQLINHLAAQVDLNQSFTSPDSEVENAVTAVENLLSATKTYRLEKFIFASSGGALYEETSQPLSESAKLNPQTPYAVAKLAVEKYLQDYAANINLPYIILRYANVYGPGQLSSNRGIIAIMINALLQEQPLIIYGDGSQTRDFVFIDDVVRANTLVSQSDIQGKFNISSGSSTSLNQLYKIIQHQAGRNLQPIVKKARNYEKRDSCLSYNLAKKEFGWEPQINLAVGIKLMLASITAY